jgi:hypothetical protein
MTRTTGAFFSVGAALDFALAAKVRRKTRPEPQVRESNISHKFPQPTSVLHLPPSESVLQTFKRSNAWSLLRLVARLQSRAALCCNRGRVGR